MWEQLVGCAHATRTMNLTYVIVGQLPGGKLHDLHRDGIIYGIPEHTEFISTLLGTDLGPLHGTTRRRQDQPVNPRTASARAEARAWLFGPPVRQPVVREVAAIADVA